MRNSERQAKQEQFLEVLGACASIKAACKIVDISRQTVYNWEKRSATFRKAMEEAGKNADDTVDDEIVRRAVYGVEKPLVSMGNLVYEYEPEVDDAGNQTYDTKGKPKMIRTNRVTIREYSDSLLLALAKSRMPKYREKSAVELTGKDGGPIETQGLLIDTRNLSAEQLAILKSMAQTMKEKEQ